MRLLVVFIHVPLVKTLATLLANKSKFPIMFQQVVIEIFLIFKYSTTVQIVTGITFALVGHHMVLVVRGGIESSSALGTAVGIFARVMLRMLPQSFPGCKIFIALCTNKQPHGLLQQPRGLPSYRTLLIFLSSQLQLSIQQRQNY